MIKTLKSREILACDMCWTAAVFVEQQQLSLIATVKDDHLHHSSPTTLPQSQLYHLSGSSFTHQDQAQLQPQQYQQPDWAQYPVSSQGQETAV